MEHSQDASQGQMEVEDVKSRSAELIARRHDSLTAKTRANTTQAAQHVTQRP